MQNFDFAKALKRRWPVVVIAALLGALIAYINTPAKPPPIEKSYRATHTMLVSSDDPTQYVQSVGTIRLSQVPLFATTGEVPKRVAERLGWTGAPAALAAQVEATIDEITGTFKISAQGPDPDQIVRVADAFADETVGFLAERQDEVVERRLATTLGRLTDLEAQVQELDGQLLFSPNDNVLKAKRDAAVRQYGAVFEQYERLSEEDTTNINLTTLERAQAVETATGGFQAPRSRSTRVPLAAAIGAILGLGFVILLERLDGRLRDKQQTEQVLGSPVLAELPTLTRKQRSHDLIVKPEAHGLMAESYRTLRTALIFLAQDGVGEGGPATVFVVTSASPGDGKTTTAANVAAAFAETGRSVVVVNADFRRPKISKFLVGADQRPPRQPAGALRTLQWEQAVVDTNVEGVWLLDLAGTDAQPGDLTRATARLVADMRSAVDVVIVDTPPISATAEALEFLPDASAVVVVTRAGRTTVANASRLAELLKFAGATTIGGVLCGTGRPTSYRYRYYGYYSRSSDEKQRRRVKHDEAPTTSNQEPVGVTEQEPAVTGEPGHDLTAVEEMAVVASGGNDDSVDDDGDGGPGLPVTGGSLRDEA